MITQETEHSIYCDEMHLQEATRKSMPLMWEIWTDPCIRTHVYASLLATAQYLHGLGNEEPAFEPFSQQPLTQESLGQKQ